MSHKLTYEGEAGGDAGVGEGDGRLQNALALAQHVVEEGLKHTHTQTRGSGFIYLRLLYVYIFFWIGSGRAPLITRILL